MKVGIAFFVIILAGAIGGAVNALLTHNGFILPKKIEDKDFTIVKPGYMGNILIGAVSGIVSWGLYGPIAGANILAALDAPLSLASFAGAILVGIAGARWLTNEVDKSLFKAAAIEAAKKPADIDASQRISNTTSPEKAFKIAKGITD